VIATATEGYKAKAPELSSVSDDIQFSSANLHGSGVVWMYF